MERMERIERELQEEKEVHILEAMRGEEAKKEGEEIHKRK